MWGVQWQHKCRNDRKVFAFALFIAFCLNRRKTIFPLVLSSVLYPKGLLAVYFREIRLNSCNRFYSIFIGNITIGIPNLKKRFWMEKMVWL
jgi:hypothetical protein